MVSPPPITIAAASGSSMRDRVRPVREDSREATGRNSDITAGFCITELVTPAAALVNSNRRDSTPLARRNSQPARRFNAPVRSRPAPRIMALGLLAGVVSSGATHFLASGLVR